MPERTRIRRLPAKAVDDRAVLDSILDAALVAHVAIADDGQPYALPVGCARDKDQLLLHGSTASRLFRRLGSGAPCCVTVTLLDGLVMARSGFESSMHYRSAMILGRAEELSGAAKERGLEVLTEHFMPGRLAEIRKSTAKELRATSVVAIQLSEYSVKVSAGEPDDPPADLSAPIWAGIIPLRHTWGEPIAAQNLAPGIDPPGYLKDWTGRA